VGVELVAVLENWGSTTSGARGGAALVGLGCWAGGVRGAGVPFSKDDASCIGSAGAGGDGGVGGLGIAFPKDDAICVELGGVSFLRSVEFGGPSGVGALVDSGGCTAGVGGVGISKRLVQEAAARGARGERGAGGWCKRLGWKGAFVEEAGARGARGGTSCDIVLVELEGCTGGACARLSSSEEDDGGRDAGSGIGWRDGGNDVLVDLGGCVNVVGVGTSMSKEDGGTSCVEVGGVVENGVLVDLPSGSGVGVAAVAFSVQECGAICVGWGGGGSCVELGVGDAAHLEFGVCTRGQGGLRVPSSEEDGASWVELGAAGGDTASVDMGA
jgi:hypothetical protein